MITQILLMAVFSLAGFSLARADNEKIIFLHHSTGGNVYNQGGVAEWIRNYNQAHSTGYQISERAYPNSPYPWQNYPYDYWHLWLNNACNASNPNIECLNTLAQDYDVIIFKHCFPGAGILPDTGSPSVSSQEKRLENYKLQYRALRDLMDSYPDTIFIVWTLAPLHRNATNAAAASRAKQFVDWVNQDFFTEGGKPHPNIYIFDFWQIVAEDNPTPVNGQVNCLRYEYEANHSGSDSHPNQLANQTAGPLFAQCIVDAIESFNGLGNHSPVFDPLGNQTVRLGSQLQLTVTASDRDGDQLTLSCTNMPAGADFDAGSGLFTWTPDSRALGIHQATFTATDNGSPSLSSSRTITITVSESEQGESTASGGGGGGGCFLKTVQGR